MRYFYNVEHCLCEQLLGERRPSELQIHGAQFLAVNSNCTEVYYYDTDGIWDTYYNATDLHCAVEVPKQATSLDRYLRPLTLFARRSNLVHGLLSKQVSRIFAIIKDRYFNAAR